METITIIGGYGKVAQMATPLLVDAGYSVRSVIRRPEQSADIESLGAAPVVADIETTDTDSIADLLAGSQAVIWSAGAGGSGAEHTWAIDRDAAIRTMDAAETAGAKRFVMVSYFNSRLVDGLAPGIEESDGMYAYYNAKSQADEYLRTETQLDWTVLGPSVLTLEAPSRLVTVAAETEQRDLDVPSTARGNVAEVIVSVLSEQRSIHKTLNFHDGNTSLDEAAVQGI